MKASRVVLIMALMAFGIPGLASAATSCKDTYYKCLNDSWDTKGFERVLADIECGTEYIGCLRRLA